MRKDSCIQQTEGSECCLYSREYQDAQEKVYIFFNMLHCCVLTGQKTGPLVFSRLELQIFFSAHVK